MSKTCFVEGCVFGGFLLEVGQVFPYPCLRSVPAQRKKVAELVSWTANMQCSTHLWGLGEPPVT